MASSTPDRVHTALEVLVVYRSSDARAAFSALAAGGVTVHPVFAESAGVLAASVPVDCDAIAVECSPQLLSHLGALRELADSLTLPLLGLARVSPDAAFGELCDALLWLEGNTVAQQLTQHLRWHARLHSTPRSPEKRQAQRRLNFFKPYAEFFRNSADGMVVVSYSGDVLYANPVAKAFSARNPTLPGGASVIEFLQSNDRRRAASLAKALQAGQSPMSSDFSVTTTSGARVLSVSASVIDPGHWRGWFATSKRCLGEFRRGSDRPRPYFRRTAASRGWARRRSAR